MAPNSILYNNVPRKRELVALLSGVLDELMSASETLDDKAWEIFKVSSATSGIVGTLVLSLSGGNVPQMFWCVLAVVFVLYFIQMILVLLAVRPRTWGLVPGTPDGRLFYESVLPIYMAEYDTESGDYVFKDESRYLDQLLTDYLGRRDPENSHRIQQGAIAIAQANNRSKARFIMGSSVLLGLIVIGLVLSAAAAVIGQP